MLRKIPEYAFFITKRSRRGFLGMCLYWGERKYFITFYLDIINVTDILIFIVRLSVAVCVQGLRIWMGLKSLKISYFYLMSFLSCYEQIRLQWKHWKGDPETYWTYGDQICLFPNNFESLAVLVQWIDIFKSFHLMNIMIFQKLSIVCRWKIWIFSLMRRINVALGNLGTILGWRTF